MDERAALLWTIPTELGPIGLGWTEQGLSRVLLGHKASKKQPTVIPPWVKDLSKRLQKHLQGKLQDFSDVPLDGNGQTAFYTETYRIARTIPQGEVWTYQKLADRVGSPAAMRAIGQAMGKNPTPLIVPCHRVVGKSGPGGFSAPEGLLTKELLLALEGVPLTRPSLLTDRGVIRKGITFLQESDRRLGAWIKKCGPFGMDMNPSGDLYGAALRSIVFQQLTGKVASIILARVEQAVGFVGTWDPQLILQCPPEKLRGAGLSAAKVAAMIDLSQFAAAGQFPSLDKIPSMTNQALIDRISQVRGIGPWSVEMLLMFHIQRTDVFSASDYGLRKGFAKLMKRKELPSPKEMDAYAAAHWKPYRTIAAWYLWRAADGAAE